MGSACGTHYWPSPTPTRSFKSVEGTVAAFISTLLTALLIVSVNSHLFSSSHSFSVVLQWFPYLLFTSLCVSLYEAVTPLHDNLTLPLYFLVTLYLTVPCSFSSHCL